MNLRQRLDEIRQLEQKATPGEWGEGHKEWKVVGADWAPVADCYGKTDAALIAAMRNAIGPLLDVVEQQHRALSDSLMVLSGEELSKGALINALSSARAALSLMDKEVK